MRINIAVSKVDLDYLQEEVQKFGEREAMRPYIIMSERTFYAMQDVDNLVVTEKQIEYCDCIVLFNNELHFGEVDIR